MHCYACSIIDQAEYYRCKLKKIVGSMEKSDKSESNESFRNGIRTFVKDAEEGMMLNNTHYITKVCQQYNIQKRRLCDVIIVLEKVGMCQKTTADTLTWLGIVNVPYYVSNLIDTACRIDRSICYSKLFGASKQISISSITESFILCFFTFQKASLNIKQLALFLSRENGRYKTTLCKLYQVTHILEAAGIIEKSIIPGEFAIIPNAFRSKQKMIPEQVISRNNYTPSLPASPHSIESLLN
jgi:hypothetical protein